MLDKSERLSRVKRSSLFYLFVDVDVDYWFWCHTLLQKGRVFASVKFFQVAVMFASKARSLLLE
jgi:hypothetical protein